MSRVKSNHAYHDERRARVYARIRGKVDEELTVTNDERTISLSCRSPFTSRGIPLRNGLQST